MGDRQFAAWCWAMRWGFAVAVWSAALSAVNTLLQTLLTR